jgi:hypothetical protein
MQLQWSGDWRIVAEGKAQAGCRVEVIGAERGKQPTAMVTAKSDEMTLPAVVKTGQSPWHEGNLVCSLAKSVTCEHPTQANPMLEWATRRL